MGDVDDYIASLPQGAESAELARLHMLVTARVPDVGQTTSYTMPCFTYRGHPVAAVIVRRKHIAWYPYSGHVLAQLSEHLAGRSHSSGALRFDAETPLSDELVERLLDIRMGLIDRRLDNS